MFFIVSHRLMAQFRRNGGSVSYNKGLDIPALIQLCGATATVVAT